MAFLAGFPLFGGAALAGARPPRNFQFRGEIEETEKQDTALVKIQLSLLPLDI